MMISAGARPSMRNRRRSTLVPSSDNQLRPTFDRTRCPEHNSFDGLPGERWSQLSQTSQHGAGVTEARRHQYHQLQGERSVHTPLPARVISSPNTLFREVNEEGVLLNLDSERYYILDDVGTRMWQLLSDQGDVEAAVTQLLEEYEVDEETLRGDVARLLGELTEAGLITVEPAGA